MARTPSTSGPCDLLVVGAGIVGLAHALEAADRGMSVVVVERDLRPAGASVRNFGHAFMSATAPGEPLARALAARERWLRLGRDAGVTLAEGGSLLVARAQDELAVMEALASAEPERGVRMLSAREAGALAPIPTEGVLGALHGTRDVRVDPRTAVPRLARWLEEARGVRFVWGETVTRVDLPTVTTARGTHQARSAIVCPGPDLSTLFPELLAAAPGLGRVRLQMLRVAAPHGWRYAPALLTGLSLLRYPAFARQDAAAAVRERLERERPELLAAGIHLIVTQLPDGDLIVGDTHDYADPGSPFADERLDELVLGEAAALFGVRRLEVRQRWQGVYPSAPGNPFLVAAPAPGVRVVEVVSGIGMTTALGLAPAVLDDLLAPAGQPGGGAAWTAKPARGSASECTVTAKASPR